MHIIALKMRDYSHWLGRVRTGSRDCAGEHDTALAQAPCLIISTGGRTSHFLHIHPTHSAARHAGMGVLLVLWSLGNHHLGREQ
jgi:hypothetical protein